MWGGAASTGAAYAEPAEDAPPLLAVPPVVQQASEALRRALTALADGEQVELGLQAQIGLELVMLHGARLVPEQDAQQLALAAAYMRHAESSATKRRGMYADLPAAPIAQLDDSVPLPRPLADEATQAAGLAALRPHTMDNAAAEGKSSRDLLWQASALARSREIPHVDQDSYERKQLLLHDYLKKAHKPFAEAIIGPPAAPNDLRAEVPAGLVCLQWYEGSPSLCGATIEPTITLVYLLAHASCEAGAEGPFTLGQLELPRAGVLKTSRLLQQQVLLKAEAADGVLHESLGAIKELLVLPTAPTAAPATVALDDEELPTNEEEGEQAAEAPLTEAAAAAAVGEDKLDDIAQLFDPLTGFSLTDEAVCAWLATMLCK